MAGSGTSRPLAIKFWASVLEELLLMDTAKSEFPERLPKMNWRFLQRGTETWVSGTRDRHLIDIRYPRDDLELQPRNGASQ